MKLLWLKRWRLINEPGRGLTFLTRNPLPSDSPFRKLDNVIMTPHLGYVTRETYQIFYPDAVEDITSYLCGQPVRVLNPSVIGKNRGINTNRV